MLVWTSSDSSYRFSPLFLLFGCCQSTTSCTKLCILLNISEAFLHTLTCCVANSEDCAMLYCPCIHAPAHIASLFIFLFVYPSSLASCIACLVCLFPLSDCFHC